MLHEFLIANRPELIERCRVRTAERGGHVARVASDDQGIPTFLEQLVDTLRREAEGAPAPADIGLVAARHGAELLRLGFAVGQVVHSYGDVCQVVTELAIEQSLPVSTGEFRTLNRCLDSAIADAVTGFARGHERFMESQAETSHERLRALATEHRRLVEIAIQSFTAIKTGSVGALGATGALLMHALNELLTLVEQALPAHTEPN